MSPTRPMVMTKHLSLLALGFVGGLVAMYLGNPRVVPQNTDVIRMQTARSCAEAADRFYHARYPKDDGSDAFKDAYLLGDGRFTKNVGNHYHAELHRCLVKVFDVGHADGEDEIRDAFETTLIALEWTDFKTNTRKFQKFGKDVSSNHDEFQAWMTQLMTK